MEYPLTDEVSALASVLKSDTLYGIDEGDFPDENGLIKRRTLALRRPPSNSLMIMARRRFTVPDPSCQASQQANREPYFVLVDQLRGTPVNAPEVSPPSIKRSREADCARLRPLRITDLRQSLKISSSARSGLTGSMPDGPDESTPSL